MKRSELFQIETEITWERAGEGIKRQVYGYDGQIMLVKVKFEAGAIGSLHEHHQSQSSYVDSGVFEVTIGQEKKVLKKGDGYYIPPHVTHGCVCIEPGMLIDAFSPLRADFLDNDQVL